jgi:hypothetical protein
MSNYGTGVAQGVEPLHFYAVGEYGPVHFRPHYHLLLFTNSDQVSQVLRYCHDKSWKLGRSDFQRSAGGAGSYVASYVNSLCAAPLLYRSCRAFRPKSRASIGFFEKGCDFMEDEDPYAQIEQKIDSVINGMVYNFNGISVRSTPPLSYIRTLLPRFSSARNDDATAIARILLAVHRTPKRIARFGFIDYKQDSILSLVRAYLSADNSSGVNSLTVTANSSAVTVTGNNANQRSVRINSDLSALSIRATEYLQRWKEVVQFSSKDYSDQMAAQFGIKAPEYMGNHAHYIGGWSSVININEVVNTNLDSDSSQASIAGKGVSSNSGHTITYDCGAEHQVIMCVYHAVPMLDWNLTGQNPQLTVTAISDFPQPAFDQLGMQAVPALNLQNNPGRNVSGSLGYNLRYWQWKSNIDTVHAGFRAGAAYQSWSAPLDGWQVLTSAGAWSYQSMKVRPQQLNSIFVPQIDAANCSVAFDQLLCNVNFQVYAVQNLDRNGLPY